MTHPLLTIRGDDVLAALLLAIIKRGGVLRVGEGEMQEAVDAVEGGARLVVTTRTTYDTVSSDTVYEVTREQEDL